MYNDVWKQIQFYTNLNSYGRRHFGDASTKTEILVEVLRRVPPSLQNNSIFSGNTNALSVYYGLLHENPNVWCKPKDAKPSSVGPPPAKKQKHV